MLRGWGGVGGVELENIDVVLAIIMLLKYQCSGGVRNSKRNNFFMSWDSTIYIYGKKDIFLTLFR